MTKENDMTLKNYFESVFNGRNTVEKTEQNTA